MARVKEMLELVKLLGGMADDIDEMADAVLRLGPPLKKVFEPFIDWRRRSLVEAFKFFREQGMTREEALALVLDEKAAMMSFITKMRGKSSDD